MKPVTREEIVAEVRKCLGTPFKHQGRLPGSTGGLDCVGVPVYLARLWAVPHQDIYGYPKLPDGQLLEATIRSACTYLGTPRNDLVLRPGMLALFWVSDEDYPQHVGILTSKHTMVHSSYRIGTVEQPLEPQWLFRLHSVFDFPNVVD